MIMRDNAWVDESGGEETCKSGPSSSAIRKGIDAIYDCVWHSIQDRQGLALLIPAVYTTQAQDIAIS